VCGKVKRRPSDRAALAHKLHGYLLRINRSHSFARSITCRLRFRIWCAIIARYREEYMQNIEPPMQSCYVNSKLAFLRSRVNGGCMASERVPKTRVRNGWQCISSMIA